MRYFLLSLAAFLLLAVPAFAAPPTSDTVEVTVVVNGYCYFEVFESTLGFTFSDCGEYQEGVLHYNLCCNHTHWNVDGVMTNGSLPGVFTVNGIPMVKTAPATVDFGTSWVCRKDYAWWWLTTMTVPFGTPPATYVDTLTLTLYCS
jgi:hypothetical protein